MKLCRQLKRRALTIGCIAALAGGLLGVAQTNNTSQPPNSAGPADPELIQDLVAAYRILADQGILDAMGHVSVRHNRDPNRFLMARALAPELVTANDIMEFDLDSNPVEARDRRMYRERFIHGEIYKARADVKAVVHNHSPAVIPFGVACVPLRPAYHMAAFIAEGVPGSISAAPLG
jgi:HCOMODA/2-hydroxy-3-carboxy-muconic semialdehyde decarboxylase